MTRPVTIERIDKAIATTAEAMTRHDLPQLLSTLKRLEAERDRLIREGDPLDYARRVLERRGISADDLISRCRKLPSRTSARAA
jgi:hypothetical protein